VSSLRRYPHFTLAAERLPKPREHYEVGVKLHLRQPANPQRRESVAVLQVSERPLDGDASTVEVTEPLRVAGNAWEQPAAESKGQGWLILLCPSEWDDGIAASFLTLA
jgi:hypothetical protein